MKALAQGAPRPPAKPRTNTKPRGSARSKSPARRNSDPKVLAKKKETEAFRARAEAQRQARYFQWGKIRHMFPETDIREVRRAFNSWKSMVAQLRFKGLEGRPWIEHGKWLYSLKTADEMREAWGRLPIDERRDTWRRVIVSTLDRNPQATPWVLDATLDPLPPGYALSDVLNLVANYMKTQKMAATKDPQKLRVQDQVFAVLLRLLEDLPPGHMPLEQRTWGLFARNLRVDQAARIHEVLRQSNAILHPNTSLQFARRLAGGPAVVKHKAAAFRIMRELAEGGMDLNQAQPASVITSLLHCEDTRQASSSTDATVSQEGSHDSEEGDFSPTRALQAFMEKGFLPNVVTFTAYLDSLGQRRDVAEVVRLAQLFSGSGLKLDAKAYATIFRGAKQSLSVDHVRDVLELSRSNAKVPVVDVLNNALHALFFFSEVEMREKKVGPSEQLVPFLPMLRVYAAKFDMKPLQALIPDSLPLLLMRQGQGQGPDESSGAATLSNDGSTTAPAPDNYDWSTGRTLLPVVDAFVASTGPERLQPDSTTLATMLRAYIRSLWRPYDLMSLYEYFKSRLVEGRPSPTEGTLEPKAKAKETERERNYAAEIVRDEGSLIHDSLILAMMQQPGLTRPALDIFGDMLKDNLGASSSGGEEVQQPSVAAHPLPSIFTFGILINGLMRRGESDLAEQVIQIMRENGVDTSVVTWNTQIKWYALMQNVPRTVGALQGLEAAGFRPDEATFRAFGKLRDQKRALAMMERIIDLNKQRMMGE